MDVQTGVSEMVLQGFVQSALLRDVNEKAFINLSIRLANKLAENRALWGRGM